MNKVDVLKRKNSKELIKAIISLESKKDVSNFLRDLMTPQEIEIFAARFQAATLLDQGKLSYREISKETGMSTTTVTRINNWLERGMGGYKAVIDKLYYHHKT